MKQLKALVSTVTGAVSALAKQTKVSRVPRRNKNVRRPPPTTSKTELNGVRMLQAPLANGFGYGQLNLGMEDMDVTMRYIAGYARVGNGTYGASSTVYFEPATSPVSTPYTSTGLVPIAPGDTSSITTGVGFGTSWTNQLLQLFRRQRYDTLHLSCLPYGAGSSATSGAQLTVAPYRGAPVATSQVATGTAYSMQTMATGLPLAQDVVLSAKGSQAFPSWQPMTWNMTPFIAGGSGAKQNEFVVGSEPNGATDLSLLSIPAAFAVTGTAPSSLDGQRIAVFIATARTGLLDFSYLPASKVDPLGKSTGAAPTAAAATSPDEKNLNVKGFCPVKSHASSSTAAGRQSPTESFDGVYVKPSALSQQLIDHRLKKSAVQHTAGASLTGGAGALHNKSV